MFKRSAEGALCKATKKAEREARRKEFDLQYAFKAGAKLEKVLTTMKEENEAFDFLSEKNENGMYFVTNIPVKGHRKDKDMNIEITGLGIDVSVDDTMLFRGKILTPSARKAARIAKRYAHKRGLTS